MSNFKPPDLPTHISPNGEEIWDWVVDLANYTSLLDECRTLNKEIRNARNKCGSCRFWMTNGCPKEKRSKTGRPTGPSCQEFKCGTFSITKIAEQFMAQKQERLKEVVDLLK